MLSIILLYKSILRSLIISGFRVSFSFLIFTLLTGCYVGSHKSSMVDFSKGEWVDLSYTYDENTPSWPTEDGFKLDTLFEGQTDDGYYHAAFHLTSPEHIGTHIDAPIHFAADGKTVDELDVNDLIGDAVVIDVSENAVEDRDYLISIADFQKWEAVYGRLPDDIIVLVRTGYGKYWPDRERYMGTAEIGEEAVAKLHFPGLAPEAAEWLVTNRKIKAIGLDTPSIDFGQSKKYKTHQILCKAGIPAMENVANLDRLPSKGLFVVALPMKIGGGSGGPLRIVAHVNSNTLIQY